MSFSTARAPTRHWIVVWIGLELPTVVTWIYFLQLDDAPSWIQQTAFATGKTVQFLLPLAAVHLGWVRLAGKPDSTTDRSTAAYKGEANDALSSSPASSPSRRRSDGGLAIVFGILAGGLIIGAYTGLLAGTELGGKLAEAVRGKVDAFGVHAAWQFAAMGIFYSIVHSGLEEYYWRWFVFGALASSMRLAWAVAISSLGFMAHHVLLLGLFLGWNESWTWLASLGVAVGGAFWAWLYHRTGRLRYPWISHMLVDAAIFGLGYYLWTTGRR